MEDREELVDFSPNPLDSLQIFCNAIGVMGPMVEGGQMARDPFWEQLYVGDAMPTRNASS